MRKLILPLMSGCHVFTFNFQRSFLVPDPGISHLHVKQRALGSFSWETGKVKESSLEMGVSRRLNLIAVCPGFCAFVLKFLLESTLLCPVSLPVLNSEASLGLGALAVPILPTK